MFNSEKTRQLQDQSKSLLQQLAQKGLHRRDLDLLRQVFNDTDQDTLWLILGAPDNEFGPDGVPDLKKIYPVEPTQLPKELAGVVWPPQA